MVLQHCPNIEKFIGDCTGITGKLLSDRSFRGADQSAYNSFRENSSGDIAVLANCKSLSVFNAYQCPGITGKFSRIVLSRTSPQSAHKSFRENSSGDIAVLANCKSLSVFNAEWCRGMTGKCLSDRSFADQSAHESFREKS